MYINITLKYQKTPHRFPSQVSYEMSMMSILTHCGQVTYIWDNIGLGNGLVPDGTKQLPELMLTYQ